MNSDELKRLKVIKHRCETDLLFFTRYFFWQLQGRKFLINHHHPDIVGALRRVETGEYPNLVINLPPRYGKTEIVVKMWIAQTFARNSAAAFIHVSYSDQLALDNSAYAREIVQHPAFQQLWPVEIKDDANTKGLWKTTTQGGVRAGSAGGPITGFGAGNIEYQPGDLFAGAVISDDPLKPDDAMQKKAREAVNWRFSNTLMSRRNGGDRTPIVLVMQRLHEDDPSGYALAGKLGIPFAHLKIKALLDDGSALWPIMHTADRLRAMKEADRYTFAGQYQQEPSPEGGAVFKLPWFTRYGVRLASYDLIVQSWDTAGKDKKANDPSVCTTWGIHPTGFHLLEVLVKRMEFPELKRAAVSSYEKWGPNSVLIEDKSSGQALIQQLRSETRLPIIAINPENDKATRARAEAPQVEAGKVALPESAPWLLDYEQELTLFPNAAHDDQVDSTSQFLRWMRTQTAGAEPRIRSL